MPVDGAETPSGVGATSTASPSAASFPFDFVRSDEVFAAVTIPALIDV